MSEFMTQAIIYMPYEMAMSDEISRRQLYARAQEILSERDQLRAEVERLRNLLAHGSNIHALPFADKILGKLRRFNEQVGDPDSGGSDIGRHWLDMLTQLGLLNRVQRSPAMWEITAQGEDALCAYGSPAFY